MISALHHSRVAGTKPNCFRQGKNAVAFGWEAIEGLLKRELQRIQSGQLARVPGLKESFVHRDTWTRLNVKPAKIMQVGSPSLCISLSPSPSLLPPSINNNLYIPQRHTFAHIYSKSTF